MYCEIVAKHHKPVTLDELTKAIGEQLGKAISLESAYQSSAIYRQSPTRSSVLAFETVHNCFVILRSINYDFCTYHLEGNDPSVSLTTLFDAVQEFSSQLRGLFHASNYHASPGLTIRLFEDNGRETSVQGKATTIRSVLGEKFAWKEVKSSAIQFVTALLLIWLGLRQEPVRSAVYSVVIVVPFYLADAMVAWRRRRGKIDWQLKQN
jgi:hypothetical protein